MGSELVVSVILLVVPAVAGLVTPLNSSRALVDALIAAKIEQVLLSVRVGFWQLPTRVVPT